MPCNSDYLEPTHREAELQRAAKLLVYVTEAVGKKPAPWVVKEAANIYASNGRSVTELCKAVKALSQEDLDRIVYNARDKTARDLADWWETHQAADAEREAREQAEAKSKAERAKVLAKLSKKDRKILGV